MDSSTSLRKQPKKGNNMEDKDQQRPLFVYGTLLPGEPLYAEIESSVLFYKVGVLCMFELYDMGSYPAACFVFNIDKSVMGQILYLDTNLWTKTMGLIDRIEGEGHLYHRSLYRVYVPEENRPETAWVYVMERPLILKQRGKPIPSGNWISHYYGNPV
jgi:gamma-glutamylcyclotransferase (GGCT)/AIG2-like uncharacterized protein YtfP